MILLSPFSRKIKKDDKELENAKNYPYWNEVLFEISKIDDVIQIGSDGEPQLQFVSNFYKNLHLQEIEKLLKDCVTWVSVDTFLQHLANLFKKPGVVIFGKSDPEIFGYPYNKNLLKDRKYLRPNQFDFWTDEPFVKEVFIEPPFVVSAVQELYSKNLKVSYTDKISALLVTKNRLEFAKRAIDCYLKQTYKNKELIVVDNSSDKTQKQELKSFVKSLNNSSIKYFQSSLDTLGKLRNFSIQQSTGSYLVQWDDDDIYSNNRIEIQYKKLTESKSDFCVVDKFKLLDLKENKTYIINKPLEGSLMVKKSCMVDYPESMNKFEDTSIIHYFWLKNLQIVRISDESIYTYVYHGDNVSGEEHFKILTSQFL